jgi:hypothetical protein
VQPQKRERRKGSLAAFAVLLVGLALAGAGCPASNPSIVAPEGSGTCAPQRQGLSTTWRASESTVLGRVTYRAEIAGSVAETPGRGSGSATQRLAVWRNNEQSLQVDTTTDSDGHFKVRETFGAGFHGLGEATFRSDDRVTLIGVVDGRAMTPSRLDAKPESLTFSDGREAPRATIDDDLSQALHLLLDRLQRRCKPATSPDTASATAAGAPPRHGPTPRGEPGHTSNTEGSAACVECVAAFTTALVGCGSAVAFGCTATLPIPFAGPFLYAGCVVIGAAACLAAFYAGVQTSCHDPAFNSDSGGGPCCPVVCGGGGGLCCDSGENCVGSSGLCCSPGLTPCGTENCCNPGDTCLATGTCCPSTQAVCSVSGAPPASAVCCGVGSTCQNGACSCPAGSCFNADGDCQAVGTKCLLPDSCTSYTWSCPGIRGTCGGSSTGNAPDGTSCGSNRACSRGTCVCSAKKCGETCCPAGVVCATANTCCPAAQTCSGGCCGEGEACCNGTCCNGTCTTSTSGSQYCCAKHTVCGNH